MFDLTGKDLTRKILVAITATIVVLFGGTLWYATSQTQGELRAIQHESNQQFGAFVQNTLTSAMKTKNPDEINNILRGGAGNVGLIDAHIVNAEGTITYSSDLARVSTALIDNAARRAFDQVKRSDTGIEGDGSNVSIIAMPLRSTQECLECHKELGKLLGAIVLRHDVSGGASRLTTIKNYSFWYFAAALAVTILVLQWLIRMLVLNPIFQILDSAREMAHGNLTRELQYTGSDQIGQLAESLRKMQYHLHKAVKEALSSGNSINEAVAELDDSSENLVQVAMEQTSGAAQQAASVHEVTSTAQEIAATSSQISANVENIRTAAEETFQACIRGRDDVDKTVEGMETVKDQVRNIADSAVELGRKSQKISSIVSIIDEISEQTHLLALNAAIEAAGAGEHGKRFSVVAGEVRRLAERTAEATAEIKGLIEEMQDSTNETVMITERGTSIVLEGASKVDLIGASLQELLAMVLRTKDATKEMAVATRQQALAGDQLVTTISDINSVAVQVSRAAEQVEKSALKLKTTARALKDLADGDEAYSKFIV